MNSSRRKFAAILEALGVPPSARRSAATPAAPACESLEGRQLLTGGMGMAGLGLPGLGVADVAGMDARTPGAAFPGVASTAGATNAQSQADVAKLQADMQTIQDQSQVTPAMTSAVTADITAIKSAETTTPNAIVVANLDAAVKAADATQGGPTIGQAVQLEVDQNMVFLSQGVSTTLIDQLDADRLTVIEATGITAAEEATLAADHAAITADQAKAAPVAGTTTTTPVGGTTTTSAATSTPMMTSPAMPMTMAGGMTGLGGVAGNVGGQGELDTASASVLVPSAGGAAVSPLGGVGMPWMGGSSSSTNATLTADQATLKTDTTTLKTEMQLVQKTSNVTPAMEAVVRADLQAVQGAASAEASSTAMATLKSDITTALTNSGGPTSAQTAQVQADQAAVYAGEGVNATLIAKLQSAQSAVTTASAITPAEEAALYADQQTVQADETKVKADIAALPPVTTTTTTSTNAAGTTTTAPATAAFPGYRAVGGNQGDLGFGGIGFPG